MAANETDWSVLIPVEILKGETISEPITELLATVPVVILGYHVLPEQTPPGQAQLQYEDQAQAKLDDLAAVFTHAGGSPETRLVFTHDAEQTMNRVADETDSEAILIPNPTLDITRVLVPLRGDVNAKRVAGFVAALISDRNIGITLYHVTDEETTQSAGEALVETAATQLRENGIADSAIEQTVEVSDRPLEAIIDQALDHDAVIMGESEPSLRSFVFGDVSEQIAAESLGPVIVVRKPRESTPTTDEE